MRGSLVFVYGTLRKGGHYHDRFLKKAQYIGKARAWGTMYSLGRYPTVEFDDKGLNSVTGELYKVDAQTLESLDGLEGYDEDRSEMSLYIRRKVWTDRLGSSGPQESVEAWVYEYNGSVAGLPVVENGDWIEHVKRG